MLRFRFLTCSCCKTRLDAVKYKGFRRLTKDDLLKKINNAKSTFLRKNNKVDDGLQVQLNDYICNSCILFAINFVNVMHQEAFEIDCSPDSTASSSSVMEDSTVNTSANEDLALTHNTTLREPYLDKIDLEERNKDTEHIILDFMRSYASHKSCIICKRKNIHFKLTVVPLEAIVDAFIQTEILIPRKCRCCAKHLLNLNI